MDTILHKAENCTFLAKDANLFTEAAKDEGIKAAKRKANTKREGRCGQTMVFDTPVYVIGYSTYVGTKEGKGPLKKYFNKIAKDDKLKQKSFECAEIKMLQESILDAIKNSGKKVKDMDLLLSGDLLNQITSSSFVARELQLPFIGLYSACSTMSSSLALGASLISAGYYDNIVCATSSHFATAERQYRYPLEYGCQRPPYAQWTVTGAAGSVLSNQGEGIRVTMAVIGRVVDFGTNDLNNMGAAMAPVDAIIPP